MLTEALTALAAARGTAVVQAAGTDAWVGFRSRVAKWVSQGDAEREQVALERLDRTADALEAASPGEVEQVRAGQEASWQSSFETLLEGLDDNEQQRAADELHTLLEPLAPPTRLLSVFEVAIRSGTEPDRFRVEVVTSPVGEASEEAGLDAEALLARRRELQQAVLASAVATRRVLPETERCVRDVGRALFAALLGTGEVAGRYRASAAVAAERGEELRVVLRIDDPLLAGLPWEAMWDEAAGGYVCRRDQLVRHVPVPSAAAPLAVNPPLRILAVVSSPRGLPALDVDKEKEQLERALDRLAGAGLAEVVWAPSATWADLQDELLSGTWHVVHYVGHGDFDPDRDEGVLSLVREGDGRADVVEASRLVDLLRQARPVPRLVVLNSCSGAAAGVTDLFSGTAAALVRGGVSAVAAMQYEISDPASVAFARGFYGAVVRGRGVDEAVSSGRVAIMGLSGRTLEWVTPVLYLRGRDSRLFTLPVAPSLGERRKARE